MIKTRKQSGGPLHRLKNGIEEFRGEPNHFGMEEVSDRESVLRHLQEQAE
jgi:hypothetical protein